MSLTQEQRDALPGSAFAVPETRQLPIHDKSHVTMAWRVVDRTKGLSDTQREEARSRILKKAEELGIDTTDWEAEAEAAAVEAAVLTTDERKALTDEDYAVPGKKKLPIPNEAHVRNAWSRLPQTKGLTSDEKRSARERILQKAKDLGLDTTDWKGEAEAAADSEDPADKIDDSKVTKEAIAALAAVLASMSVNMWAAYIAWMGPQDGVAPDAEAATAYGAERAEVLLGMLNDTTRKQISAALAAGAEAGETDAELAQRVQAVMAPMMDARTNNIAVSESTRANGWSGAQAAKQAGKDQAWTTMRDGKVRDTHSEMDGQVKAAGEYFTSPSGAMTLHPGGFGVAEEDCGCRCGLIPVKDTVEAAKASADSDWAHFEALRKTEEERLVPVLQGIFKAQTDAVVKSLTPPIVTLHAMSLDMPETPDHPNKMPFSGVLTFLDRPSDNAPCGSGGKKVTLTRAAAEQALPTLLGMGIDHTSNLDGHDVKSKIGIIDEANIVGDQIDIKGFLYAADFPKECAQIKLDKEKLGFSWELKDINVDDLNADPWVINSCIFTGAALLQKQKAAYVTTSLAAAADGANVQELDMATVEELMKKIDELTSKVAKMEEDENKEEKNLPGIHANAVVVDKVKPHSDNLRKLADEMEAAGVGCHASRGHALHLRKMASAMDAEAAKGMTPSGYYPDGGMYGSADVAAMVASAVAEATKTPVEKTPDPQVAVLKDEIASMATMIKDLQASSATAQQNVVRKTLPPAVSVLLAKAGIQPVADGEERMTIQQLDAALGKTTLTTPQKMEAKAALRMAGQIA